MEQALKTGAKTAGRRRCLLQLLQQLVLVFLLVRGDRRIDEAAVFCLYG